MDTIWRLSSSKGLERDPWRVRFLNYGFVLTLNIQKVNQDTILSEKISWRICIVWCHLYGLQLTIITLMWATITNRNSFVYVSISPTPQNVNTMRGEISSASFSTYPYSLKYCLAHNRHSTVQWKCLCAHTHVYMYEYIDIYIQSIKKVLIYYLNLCQGWVWD